MPATKGQTGSTLKITLDPYLLQVGFTDQIVSTGGAIGVQAIVMNVADEAKIQLTFLDGQGSSVGELKGVVYSGVFRGLFKVEEPNSTGHMVVVAELPDYGLKLAGPACKVTPPILVENLKWMSEDGSKELEAVVRGQKVKLTADVTQGPMDGEAVMTIKILPADAKGSDKGHSACQHDQAKSYKYPAKIKSKKIEALFRAEWDAPDRKSKLEYTINLLGRDSKPSKKVGFVMAFEHSE